MFGFLKDKLKSWFGKSKEKIEIAEAKKEKKPKKKEKLELKEEKPKIKNRKPEKKKRTKQELQEERKITQEILKDVQKEGHEIKSPEQQTEEFIKELEEKEIGIEIPEKAVEELKTEEIQEQKKEQTKENKEKKSGFFERLKNVFSYTLTKDKFEELFSELELLLLESNVALEVVEKIKSDLQEKLVGKQLKKEKIELEVKEALKSAINDILIDPEDTIKEIKEFRKINTKEPYVILFFGINGAGKTTSIAKLAHLIKKNKLSCVLAAADTFRAAAVEQISIHAERLGVKVIKQDYGSDPSAVAFDAIKYAKSNNLDVVLVDTAGRMHTKENLLHEMQKICRVTKPNLKVFVAEAVAGNDVVNQCRAFNEAIGIDGIILTKSDVDEKGGAILSVSYITKKPILYLGVGQNYDDLEIFDSKKILEKMGL